MSKKRSAPPHKQSKGFGTRSGRQDCPWRNGGTPEERHGRILDPHECSEEAKEWQSQRYGYEYGYRFTYEGIINDEEYIATVLEANAEKDVSLEHSELKERPLPNLDLVGMAKMKSKKVKPQSEPSRCYTTEVN